MSLRTVLMSAAAVLWLAAPALADGGPTPEPPAPPPAEPMPEEPAPEPAPAPAETMWYAEAYMGASYADELAYGCCDFPMEIGLNGGGAIGGHLTPNVDLEVDVFYSVMGYEGFDTSISGLSFMFNALYNFDTGAFVDPYFGAGIGVTRVRYDGADQFPAFTGHDWQAGYQGMAGLMFHLDAVDLFIEYRYSGVFNDSTIEGVGNIEYQSHNGSAGFRLNF
jgi:opacity protein-like surface antigen